MEKTLCLPLREHSALTSEVGPSRALWEQQADDPAGPIGGAAVVRSYLFNYLIILVVAKHT